MPRLAFTIFCLSVVGSSGCHWYTNNDQSCELQENVGKGPCPDARPVMCTTACTGDLAVCDTDTGTCVQCFGDMASACGGKMPVCASDHRCAACTQHSECKDSNVCLPDGSCAAITDVAYVDPAGTNNPDCTKATPCTNVMTALATKRPYVKLHGTTDEAVTINQDVTLLADPAATLTRSTDGAILQIMGTSQVEIDDLQISGGTNSMNDPGIVISGGSNVTLLLKRAKISGTKDNGITSSSSSGSITIEASTISNNQKAGVNCQDCSLTISQSTISGNQGGGITTGGMPTFAITNTFIDRNGSTGSSVGGALLTLSPGHANRFEFNTVIDNHVKAGSSVTGGVQCDDPNFMAPNNLIVRNYVNNDPNLTNANTSGACTYPTSAVDPSVTTLKFQSPDSSPYDYHIQSGSSAIGKASTSSSITVDFDNQSRPKNASDQGADQYTP